MTNPLYLSYFVLVERESTILTQTARTSRGVVSDEQSTVVEGIPGSGQPRLRAHGKLKRTGRMDIKSTLSTNRSCLKSKTIASS